MCIWSSESREQLLYKLIGVERYNDKYLKGSAVDGGTRDKFHRIIFVLKETMQCQRDDVKGRDSRNNRVTIQKNTAVVVYWTSWTMRCSVSFVIIK